MSAHSGEAKQELFTSYYAQYYNEFYRYAYYFLGNAEDAEDAVADSITAAFSSFDSLRDVEKFKFWFLKILQNNCKAMLKKRRFPISIESEYESGELDIVDNSQNPEEAALISSLLEEMSPDDRTVILLSVLGGYSSNEIAEFTGMSPANVRVRMHRALSSIRKNDQAELSGV